MAEERLKHRQETPALLIYDAFRAHCTEKVTQALTNLNAKLVMVPKNLTDHLQPLDLSVNKPAKQFLANCFSVWYSEQVLELERSHQLEHEELVKLLKSTAKLRDLSGRWICVLYDYMRQATQQEQNRTTLSPI